VPRLSLSAGETQSIYSADRGGERLYIRVESGEIAYARSDTFVRDGRTLSQDDRAADLQATESGEELYVYALEDSEITFERQGWIADLFSPRNVEVSAITTTSDINISGASLDVPTTLSVENSRNADFVEDTFGEDVSQNTSDTFTFTSDPNTIWVVRAIEIDVDATSATGGTHYVEVQRSAGDVPILKMESNYDSKIQYQYNQIETADVTKKPSDGTAQALAPRGLLVDQVDGIEILYRNETDDEVTFDAFVALWVEKIVIE